MKFDNKSGNNSLGDNHLNLAADLKLGTNRLEEIAVVGARIDDIRKPFKPAA
jgi:hypothetical protein